jgi:hypothetical protein
MKPRPTIPVLSPPESALARMLDGIFAAVDRVLDKPRRKQNARSVEIGESVEYEVKTA